MLRWILAILVVNGILSFGYAVTRSDDPTALWAALAVNFTFYLGITQAGIVFSAIMRIAKSEWGKYFSRLGEIITLSFMPVAFITFIVLYLGGTDDLFYWARAESSETHDAHLSPWLGKGLFFWRNIITMTLFYAASYLYFMAGRVEEKTPDVPARTRTRLTLLASLVMFFFVAANTNMAWDFGMMLIRHWESSIFPPYYWVGNLFAGTAFLFLISCALIPLTKSATDKGRLDSMGKVLLGFTLLWTYLFWSQFVVIWYGNLPHLTAPLFKAMSGEFSLPFTLMIITVFIAPFFALLNRRIKLSAKALTVVSVVICAGMWINRYLMIIPVVTKDNETVFASWTGLALILAGLSATLLSVNLFVWLFPRVNLISNNAEPTDTH